MGFDSEIALRRRAPSPTLYAAQRAHPNFTNFPKRLPDPNEWHYTPLLSILNAQRHYEGARNSNCDSSPVIAWTHCFSPSQYNTLSLRCRTRRTCGCEGETGKRCVASLVIGGAADGTAYIVAWPGISCGGP